MTSFQNWKRITMAYTMNMLVQYHLSRQNARNLKNRIIWFVICNETARYCAASNDARKKFVPKCMQKSSDQTVLVSSVSKKNMGKWKCLKSNQHQHTREWLLET
jgi:hypothetical protein